MAPASRKRNEEAEFRRWLGSRRAGIDRALRRRFASIPGAPGSLVIAMRYSVLAGALLANTAALWLVFQQVMLRIRTEEHPLQSQSPPAATATTMSQSQTQIS